MNAKRIQLLIVIAALAAFLVPGFFAESGGIVLEMGNVLPLVICVPFVGMLLSIALLPLLRPHWWEKNIFNVSIFWALMFLIPFAAMYGPVQAGYELYHILLLDYLPFIVLLWGLFTVSGGILVKGSLAGSPRVNLFILILGAALASWIGTTGAAMLFIRPILRANAWREKRAHIIVFFIFIVANMGGCLTPIGDPPLYLGFLRNVPFFWTMKLAPMLLLNTAILLVVFFILDRHLYKKELDAGRKPPEGAEILLIAHLVRLVRRRKKEHSTESLQAVLDKREPISIKGAHNFVFLGLIVGAVILSGSLATADFMQNPATGTVYGIPFLFGLSIPLNNIIQMSLIALAAFLSIRTTRKEVLLENQFSWAPIKEVACIFIGIFIAMVPVLSILHTRGAELGITEPWQFFWVTGGLSSFLDNAPTYLVFMTAASALPAGADGLTTLIGSIAPNLLIAVSAGAVFMGANTYIGNAPNFMIRSIAEENKVKMPSFFGYMGWAAVFLIPVFILDTAVFFR